MTTDVKSHATGLNVGSFGAAALALLTVVLTLALLGTLLPSPASARTTRLHEGSFGFFKRGFGSPTPEALAVDQSNGDIYVTSRSIESAEGSQPIVSRFNSAGAPKNFTAGPDAGTNTLTGFPASTVSVAIDNSGGPLNGTVYAAVGGLASNAKFAAAVKVFAGSGASLGTINGTGIPSGKFSRENCGAAVDQSSGALYIAAPGNIWRYTPSSPSGAIDDADYTLTGITVDHPCDLAAGSGSVYARTHVGTSPSDAIDRYAASSFTTDFSNEPVPTTIDTGKLDPARAAIAVDPKNGDLYLNRGSRVSVFDSAGLPLYDFGAPAYFNQSEAIAVKSAVSGPAAKVYVADPGLGPGGVHEVDVFAGLTKVQTFTHKGAPDASIGSDGTSSTAFSIGAPGPLAFDQATRRLYAADGGVPGIYGFGASSPPAFPPQGGFSPLGTAALDTGSGLAVDNTALASAGNLYLASQSTDLLYGWNAAGTPLGGAFPVDPATSPGAPDGSPKNLCGSAVDSQGNVWVSNSSTKRILKYSSAGVSLPGSIDTSALGSPCNLAFDSDDDLYVGIDGTEAHKSGVWKYTASSGYSSATRVAQERPNAIFAVDPSTDRLYAARGGAVEVYESSGQLFDEFALGSAVGAVSGIAVDATNDFVYVADKANGKVHAFPPGLLFPEVATRPATAPTNTTMALNGLVNTQAIALSDCHFEYVTELAFGKTGFSDLSSGGSVPCTPAAGSIPLDLEDHPVSGTATGLVKDTRFRFRLSAANADGTTVSSDAGFTTAGPPLVETTGSPVRSTTTARLEGRVYAARAATTYRFEYGAEGPCDANPCESTEAHSAGSGNAYQLVSQQLEDLEPSTTYHYRVIADNGNPLGPAIGNGVTVTTRASDATLSHGDFPGPPGSDRAYELVSLPDTGGNPVAGAYAVSDNGDRVFYRVLGGTPISNTGTAFNVVYSERLETAAHEGGWRSQNIGPSRDQLVANAWEEPPIGKSDLSDQVMVNVDPVSAIGVVWRLRPGQPATKVYEFVNGSEGVFASKDGSRVLGTSNKSLDPANPVASGGSNVYDVTSGVPRFAGLLPDGSVPACGSSSGEPSPDGSLFFFASCGNFYIRDFDAEQTKLISSGNFNFVESTLNAIFLRTEQGLEAGDTGGSDVYRYRIDDETLKCVTCVAPSLDAEVAQVVVADDGSRVYFTTSNVLLPGATTPGIYRVDVDSGDLAYVSTAPSGDAAIGKRPYEGQAMTSDGSALVFASTDPDMNSIGGQQNGGTRQYYRYDDRDRSLTCLSCPQDGSIPVDSVRLNLGDEIGQLGKPGANKTMLSADGRIFAFATTTPLLHADQNSARPGQSPSVGGDVYEWRDGRLLLVTDGLTNWSGGPPQASAITPSGNDIFFIAATQYTQDALDGYLRVYDARIGGGFEFPVPPRPCPLEVCQGIPKGAPEEQAPGTGSFVGSGNATRATTPRTCPKGRHKARRGGKTRCVKSQGKKPNRKRAKHDRRAQR